MFSRPSPLILKPSVLLLAVFLVKVCSKIDVRSKPQLRLLLAVLFVRVLAAEMNWRTKPFVLLLAVFLVSVLPEEAARRKPTKLLLAVLFVTTLSFDWLKLKPLVLS